MKKFFARLGILAGLLFLGNLIVILASGGQAKGAGFPIIVVAFILTEVIVRSIFPAQKDDQDKKE